MRLHLLAIGRGEQRTDREQIALDRHENLVDALPELGGQLTALYPEKYVFDVAGFPKVLAKDLVRMLAEQANQFAPPIHLSQRVTGLEQEDGHFVLVTETDRFASRSILIAA